MSSTNDHHVFQAPSSHVLELRVRYCECDPMGVAHHSVYPIWFEMGRTELLRAQGGNYRRLEEEGVLLAVVKLEVRYRRPARYDDVLELETRLKDAGHVKIEHEYELRRGREVLAVGSTTLACLDRSGRARPLPAALGGARRKLTRARSASSTARPVLPARRDSPAGPRRAGPRATRS